MEDMLLGSVDFFASYIITYAEIIGNVYIQI